METTINKTKLDTAMLADMGYGDITTEGPTLELTDDEIATLAEAVGGTIDEIKTAEVVE